jgi:hypothetical protein
MKKCCCIALFVWIFENITPTPNRHSPPPAEDLTNKIQTDGEISSVFRLCFPEAKAKSTAKAKTHQAFLRFIAC